MQGRTAPEAVASIGFLRRSTVKTASMVLVIDEPSYSLSSLFGCQCCIGRRRKAQRRYGAKRGASWRGKLVHYEASYLCIFDHALRLTETVHNLLHRSVHYY